MGLSEREQQLLEEMERRLYQSEADVMQTAQGSRTRLNARSLVLGILVGLVGLAALVGGVAAQQLWLGVVGFAVMMVGALFAFSKRESAGESVPTRGPAARRSAPEARESFSDRMQRRWDERMEGER